MQRCAALPLKGYGMSEQGARPVATAGVMTAAAVIYALAAICLPLPTMMMGMLWPVFIALVTVCEGLRWGLLVSIAALLLTLPLATPAMGAFFVLSFAPTGLAIGGLFRRRADTLRALTGGVLASLGGKGAAVLMMFLLFGLNPFAVDFSTASEAVNETLAVYRSLGIDEVRLEQTRAVSMQALESFALVLPALFLGGSVIEAAACFVVLRNVLVRLGIPAAPFPAFTEWRLPIGFSYLFAFSLIGLYWGTTRDITLLYRAALNGYLIATLAGLVQGLSFLQFMMKRYGVASFVRLLVYITILVNGLATQIVTWTGLFDIVFDYRKKMTDHK